MGQIISFHKTAHGYSHIQRDQPCEDASGSYYDENGRYHIAVVSDGHGQARSFRSAVGSKVAVDVAVDCLKELAEGILSTPEEETAFYRELLESPRDRILRVRQLTDTVLSRWYAGIQADYAENPPSQEELGEFAEYYADSGHIPEIYGATLIAALRLPGCLILLHQGDGRCDVFYEDGSVDQPIPWDDRCQGTFCTSLCEESAYEAIRHCVIDLNQTPVIACYLGSDGVEDAYRDQEGTYIFYKHLSCLLTEKSPEEFDAFLEEFLPEFSAYGFCSNSGSLDDVSVAGIVEPEAFLPWKDTFAARIRRFELEEKLIYEDRAYKSMIRKHTYLEEQLREAEEKRSALREEQARLQKICEQFPEQKAVLTKQLLDYKPKLEEMAKSFEIMETYFTLIERKEEPLPRLRQVYHLCKKPVLEVIKAVKDEEYRKLSARQQQLLDRKELLEEQEAQTQKKLEACGAALQAQEERAAQAKLDYETYHERYSRAEDAVREIQEQIDALRLESDSDAQDPQ